MPERRNQGRRWNARAVKAAASVGFLLWAKVAQRPVDAFAVLGAGAVTLVIVVNAVFLQSGSHPAPFFANPASAPVAADARSRSAAAGAPARPPAAAPAAQVIAVRPNDVIAQLIGPSPRILAVQRVLSDYGYGQITPNGMLDAATGAAIEKFEREHKLPVSRRVSDRLVRELTAMAGHPVE